MNYLFVLSFWVLSFTLSFALSFEIKTLRSSPCTDPVSQSSHVRTILYAGGVGATLVNPHGVTNTWKVGSFNIPPINDGVIGMCEGDRRVISISMPSGGLMEYVIDLVSHVEKDLEL